MLKEIFMVSSEQVWKGLKLELSKKEICKIFQAEKYEKGDYYDFDVFYGVIKKALNKEIDIEYFTDWCVLVANCFNSIKNRNKLCASFLIIGTSFCKASASNFAK
jgi:hypothetical protein